MKRIFLYLFISPIALFGVYSAYKYVNVGQLRLLPSTIYYKLPEKLITKADQTYSKLIEDNTRAFLKDPLYRPIDVLKEYADYEPESIIKEIDITSFRAGVISIGHDNNYGIAGQVLEVDKKPIFGIGEMITFGRVFRKSEIDLLFIATQSTGTCCGGFRNLYLLRYVKNLGLGIEYLGAINNGAEEDEKLKNRFRIVNDRIVVDLDEANLKHEKIAISPDGGKIDLSEPIPMRPMDLGSCDYLWNFLKGYLKEFQLKNHFNYKDIVDFINSSGVGMRSYVYIQGTNPAFNEASLIKISEITLKYNKLPSKIIFNKRVCGIIK